MKNTVLMAALALVLTATTHQQNPILSAEEQKLYELITAYRIKNGLSRIPLSPALTKVAQLHVQDLTKNNPANGKCNLHSWSSKGNWSPCCYTGDDASAECMWNKPKEIAGYAGAGFEIAAFATNMSATVALDGWKNSSGHNEVMINKGDWSHNPWKAVGIGMEGNYAVIWFGTLADE